MANKERSHKATYATDKRKGGYIIRVVGPQASRFAGRTVPVTTKDNSEHDETLDRLIWSGPDKETGEPVALYSFVARPRDTLEELPF
ncbi:MAG TPA: hypothetical protein VK769_05375 [Verrucomicrobiae bacterium]|jgi:hypothetical protein|nr:hypothetical protein [Verrucomicrobiae bacterium]